VANSKYVKKIFISDFDCGSVRRQHFIFGRWARPQGFATSLIASSSA
jgi:hypothetical protein